PLYSLRAHQKQRGCGFFGACDQGIYVYFPGFVLEVDTSSDCLLSYCPIGRAARLPDLDYVQPKPLVESQPSSAASSATSSPAASAQPPAVSQSQDATSAPDQSDGGSVDDDLDDLVGEFREFARHSPKAGPRPSSPTCVGDVIPELGDFATSLRDLPREELIRRLYIHEHQPSPSGEGKAKKSVRFLSTMSAEEIRQHLHHEGTTPPDPCDTSNGSDTKSHWTSEELHPALGCRRLRNFKHVMQTSRDEVWVDNGEFPLALGSYATIPKAPRGKGLPRIRDKYLDVVHMDIAFGDCASVGDSRHKYALVLIDWATRYNWVFSLRSLSSPDILSALKDFLAAVGRLSTLFRCDCNEKLFGSAVRSFLHDNGSCVEAAPSGRQSSNGLVESHWKIMVHMARAYLTEEQMPRRYWYFAIKHAARMMNMIPGKYRDKLASPFMLVHGVRPDQRAWTPIFSICYFHHERDGDVRRSHTQAHTMDGIVVGRSPMSNALLVYNPRTCRYYEPDSYRIDPYRLPSSMYPDVKYDGGLFSALLRDDNPAIEEPFPPSTRVEDLMDRPARRGRGREERRGRLGDEVAGRRASNGRRRKGAAPQAPHAVDCVAWGGGGG
ncbi:hypothetical protein ACHAWF_001311, partial [Thalassiosira exigua]